MTDAYRDASRLVQRLKDKRSGTQDALPGPVTQELEESLALGPLLIQGQYDKDVRRFGETYARGDAVAREQMKDILITLQQSVVSHLREVIMDEAELDYHVLQETSDDSRVNAVVCLGQLYQRMSTATAAVKQISKPVLEQPCSPNQSISHASSSNRSTHLSSGSRTTIDNPSTTMTSNSFVDPRVCASRKSKEPRSANALAEMAWNSTTSYPGAVNTPQSTATGHGVTSLPRPSHCDPCEIPIADSLPSILKNRNQDNFSSQNTALPPASPAFTADDSIINFLADAQLRASQDQDHLPQRPRRDYFHLSNKRQSGTVGEYADSAHLGHTPIFEEPDLNSLSAKSNGEQTRPSNTSGIGHARSHPAPAIAGQSALERISFDHTSPLTDQTTRRELNQNKQPSQEQQTPQRQSLDDLLMNEDTLHYTLTPDTARAIMVRAHRRLVSNEMLMSSQPVDVSIRPVSSHSTTSNFGSKGVGRTLPPGIIEHVKASKSPPPAPPIPALPQPRYTVPPTGPQDEFPLSQSTSISSPPLTLTLPSTEQSGTKSTSQPRITSMATVSSAPSLISRVSTRSVQSQATRPNLQLPATSLNLPSEDNLSGFCKGALRLQINSRKKGFEIIRHSSGMEKTVDSWRCTKCSFEGAALVSASKPSGGRSAVKKEHVFDYKVRVSDNGIKYRWAFLAKCHVLNKKHDTSKRNDGSHGTFGCVFCCAEGLARGWELSSINAGAVAGGGVLNGPKQTLSTPVFADVGSFMNHLQMHRLPVGMPGVVMAERMNVIVGRVAEDKEDFDLNLPHL